MIEDCLKEIRTAITANLPALFDTEDAQYAADDVAEFGTAITLRDIATVRFEDSEELNVQNLPMVFLLPRGGTEDRPWMTAQTNLVHSVECVIVESDTQPIRLSRKLFRMVEAFRRMLTTNVEGTGVTSDPVFQTDIRRIDYSPIFAPSPGGLAKAAILTVELHELEGRP